MTDALSGHRVTGPHAIGQPTPAYNGPHGSCQVTYAHIHGPDGKPIAEFGAGGPSNRSGGPDVLSGHRIR